MYNRECTDKQQFVRHDVLFWRARALHPSCSRKQKAGGSFRRPPANRRVNQCFSGYRLTKPFLFGMFTFGKVCAFITSFSPMILLPARMNAVSA